MLLVGLILNFHHTDIARYFQEIEGGCEDWGAGLGETTLQHRDLVSLVRNKDENEIVKKEHLLHLI